MSRQQAPHVETTVARRALAEARPYWIRICGLFLLGLISAPLTLLIPVPAKIVLDSVLNDQPLPAVVAVIAPDSVETSPDMILVFAVVLLLIVTTVKQLQELTTSILRVQTAEDLVMRFRARLFRHIQRLSLAYHDREGVASSLYRVQYDARMVETMALDGLVPLTTAALTLVAMIYVTTRLDWQLTLVALVVGPALLLLVHIHRGRLKDQWREAKQTESSVLGVVEEVLSTLRIVKAFGQESREADRFIRRSEEGVRSRVRVMLTQGILGLLLSVMVAGGTAAALYVGVQHVRSGVLSLGDLVLVMFYLAMLYGPLETITRKIAGLQSAMVSAERVYTILDLAPDVADRSDARSIVRASGAVVFDDIHFSYGTGSLVLKGVSFEAPAGSLVGIAGEVGVGKTTLINLLPRFYDPTRGKIFLDGVDLREYRLRDLRNQLAIVPQETILLSSTIAENIAYGRPSANRDEIVRAAEQANAAGFIGRLPAAYDTVVGQRGMLLSRGQRQLVSLARAYLKDSPLLILDEPTSAIDRETEEILLEALSRLIAGRTVFMISHRLYTLKGCDLFLRLQGGRLSEAVQAGRASAP